MDPTVVMEGGAMGAAAIGFARKRPRKGRVRREPIDLERLAAEFADAPIATAAPEPVRSEYEIIRALEAEVERVHAANATAVATIEIEVEEDPEAESEPADPFGIQEPHDEITVSPGPPVPMPASPTPPTDGGVGNTVGLPADQLQAWSEQVQEDLRKVEARIEYLQHEQARLESQHRLVAELISSSNPI